MSDYQPRGHSAIPGAVISPRELSDWQLLFATQAEIMTHLGIHGALRNELERRAGIVPESFPEPPGVPNPLGKPYEGTWPVTQWFGERPDWYKPLNGHLGIDFGIPTGTPILASADGHVIESQALGNWGEYVKLGHDFGETLYAHLSQRLVDVGQMVAMGQRIALSGNSGRSTAAHLHFGLRDAPYNRADGWDGYTDPRPFLWPLDDTPQPTPRQVVWDPRLGQRGTTLVSAVVRPGQTYWQLTKAQWRDVQESQGKHHIYVDTIDESGQRVLDVPVRFTWANGSQVVRTEAKPGEDAAANFPMYALAPAYNCQVNGHSDRVEGMGLGSIDAPNHAEHTSYYLVFQRTSV